MGGGGVYVGGTQNRWGSGICPEITKQGTSAMAKLDSSFNLGGTNQRKVTEAQAAAAGLSLLGFSCRKASRQEHFITFLGQFHSSPSSVPGSFCPSYHKANFTCE